MLAKKLTSIGAAAGGFDPEADLTLTRSVPQGATSFSFQERQEPIVLACEVTFPAQSDVGMLFFAGEFPEDWFASVGLRDGGSILRLRMGNGEDAGNRRSRFIDIVPPGDTAPHTLVWEFTPTTLNTEASIRAWIDGVEQTPVNGGGFRDVGDWAEGNQNTNFGGFFPAWWAGELDYIEPFYPWPGTILSDLRVYANQRAGVVLPADFVTFSNTSNRYFERNLLVSPLNPTTTVANMFFSDISCDEPINIRWEETEAVSPGGAAYKISVDGGAYQSLSGTLTLPAGQYNVSIAAELPFPIDRHGRLVTRPAFYFNERLALDTEPYILWARNLLYTGTSSINVVIPSGVTSIDAVAIGSGGEPFWQQAPRGGAGGGALSYTNGIPVTPGETLTAECIFPRVNYASVSSRWAALKRGTTYLLKAEAGADPSGQTGGGGGRAWAGIGAVRHSGGSGANASSSVDGGGGGAAGYAGNGGNGASGFSPQPTFGSNGSGGGGAGGSNGTAFYANEGGGVWYMGQGVNGVAQENGGGRGSRPGEDGTTLSSDYGGAEYTSDNGCVYFSY